MGKVFQKALKKQRCVVVFPHKVLLVIAIIRGFFRMPEEKKDQKNSKKRKSPLFIIAFCRHTFLEEKANEKRTRKRAPTTMSTTTTTSVVVSVSLLSLASLSISSYLAIRRFAKREETGGLEKNNLFFSTTKKKTKREGVKKAMLVISHPDDEAMFFGPTLESLKSKGSSDVVKVFCICLSNGNFDGLGQTRAKELKKSTLEMFKLDGCVIADSEDLQDGPANHWPLEEIANVVHECVQHYSPDVILTFDDKGVSKHPNHVQTHRGVMRFLMEAKMGAIPNAEYTNENTPEVWVLETTPLYRTFMGAMDYWASVVSTTTRTKHSSLAVASSSSAMFCAKNPSLILEAMRTHATQWVWFRKLYVTFSRYSLMNTFRRMDIGPPPSQIK